MAMKVYVVKDQAGKVISSEMTKKAAKATRDKGPDKAFVARGPSHPKGPSKTNIKSSLEGQFEAVRSEEKES